MRILAIDLGSTEFKAGFFDADGRLTASAARPVPYADAGCEHLRGAEVTAVWRSLIGALASGPPPERIAITSQAQTFALIRGDEAVPELFLSWRHVSPPEVVELARKEFSGLEFHRHASFSEPVPGMALVLLGELRVSGVLRPGLRPVFLSEYLVRLLTGRSVADADQAAMTGLFSRVTRRWWPPAWEWCGLRPEAAAVVIPPGTAAGNTLSDNPFGLPGGIPVILAGNDQSAGAFGSGIAPGEVFLSLGTAFAAYARLERPRVIPGGAAGEYYGGGFYALKTAPRGGDALAGLAAKRSGGDFKAFFSGPGPEDPDFRKLMDETASTVLAVNDRPTAVAAAGGAARAPAVLAALERRLVVPVRRCCASPLSGAAMVAAQAGVEIIKSEDRK